MEDHVSARHLLHRRPYAHRSAAEIVEFANSIVALVEEEIDKYKESIAEEEERIRSEDTEKVTSLFFTVCLPRVLTEGLVQELKRVESQSSSVRDMAAVTNG